MQKGKLQVWLPLLMSIMIILGIFIGFSIRGNMPSKGIFYIEKRQPVKEVMEIIDSKYVDSVSADTMGMLAINGMLSKLDPHSVFMPSEALQMSKEEIQGHFYGIGIEYFVYQDTMNVVNVLPGGPAARAGLQFGDKIIKVDDTTLNTANIVPSRIMKLLRGPAGTHVLVTILRDHNQKQLNINREGIPIYSLDASYMITSTTGYIRLNKFSETTYKEFMQAAEKLKKEGMKEMILDLRDNGGGILTEATDIADEFLDGDKLITYTTGVHSARKEYRCKREGIYETGKLVVLANEGTASASEILIGALQDWDRATIIGRRSFGKGLVQEQFELSDGSGLRLTVARYYTPLGRSIQKSYKEGNTVYNDELLKRFHYGELNSGDSIKHDTGKSFKTPGGKIVYGAGGITPDVFVPLDTLAFDKRLIQIYTKGELGHFTYKDYLDNKKEFAGYKSALELERNFTVDEKRWSDFKKFANKDSIALDIITPKFKNRIENEMKQYYAQHIWHMEGMYEVSNAEDPTIKKALEVIKK